MAPEQKPVKAKKPTGGAEGVTVAQGLEKEPAKKAEVSGHGAYSAYYSCWNCGATNYVPGGYYAFYCWKCYAYNVAP